MKTLDPVSETSPGSVRGVATYFAVAAVTLLVLVLPASIGGGDWSPAAAWGLTFVPGGLIALQAGRLRDPQQAVPFVLVSTIFRFAVAGLGGLLVVWLVPSVERNVFLAWLGGMYLVALAAEIHLTMSSSSLSLFGRPVPPASSSAAALSEGGR